MKITNWTRKLSTAIAAGGLIVVATGNGMAEAATINHTIQEASFDGIVLGSGNYAYIKNVPNYPWVPTLGNNNSWLYNTAYASDELSPFSAPNAVHLADGNIYQVINDTFVAGRQYTLSVRVGNQVNQADQNGFGLRLFDGTGSTFSGATVFATQNYSLGSDYLNDLQWHEVKLEYTATAAADGKPIGIFLGPELAANNISVDNASLTSVPEPASVALLGAGPVVLWQLVRRRRSDNNRR
jgi:hypothetical protein